MSLFFSIGSIALGLIAWAIAFVGMKKKPIKPIYPVASFSFCCTSLLLHFFEINYRTDIGDYAAIEDTIEAVIYAAVILIVVTVVLNLIPIAGKGRK